MNEVQIRNAYAPPEYIRAGERLMAEKHREMSLHEWDESDYRLRQRLAIAGIVVSLIGTLCSGAAIYLQFFWKP